MGTPFKLSISLSSAALTANKFQEGAPNESADDIDEGSTLASSGHHSYSAITAYLQSGTYPNDADKKQKNSLRKRAKFFVMLGGKLHYIGGHGKKTMKPPVSSMVIEFKKEP